MLSTSKDTSLYARASSMDTPTCAATSVAGNETIDAIPAVSKNALYLQNLYLKKENMRKWKTAKLRSYIHS